VASYLNTNTKYLSYMIKKYKKKDFSGYVNELRINCIIGKLNTDPVYRQYKISVLAEEAGFSSHSKFATV
uniref:helix-turn-helix domain-containing protein n=1 Tax=Elizabethkingia meningoseptica TaxID=238 RepID=UPI003AFB1A7D